MTQPYPIPEIFEIDRAEIALETWSWPFATERSADIDRYFAELQSLRPGVWNGRVLLLNRYAIVERALRGACFEVDYASFITWRDGEFPDPDVYNFLPPRCSTLPTAAICSARWHPIRRGRGAVISRAGRRSRPTWAPTA